MGASEPMVIMSIEPSSRLSELCGFPYFIEKRFTVQELLEKGVIDENDIREMRQGKQICKKVPVIKGDRYSCP